MKDREGRKSIHRVLARSYFMHILVFLFGMLLSRVYDFAIYENVHAGLGFLLLLFGTIIVMWAQSTSGRSKEHRKSGEHEKVHASFLRGPYRFYRSPTHLGLLLLTLGAGILANSGTIVLAALFAFLLTRLTFIHEEEKLLREKYGESYRHYQKKVPL